MSVRIHKTVIKQQDQLSLNLGPVLHEAVLTLESQARESVKKLVYALFEQEIEQLAGPSHRRGRDKFTDVFRAGSDPGSVLVAGQRMSVKKPRIKRSGKDVQLKSYLKLQDWDLLTPRIMEYMVRGVSTRDYGELINEIAGGLGISKSAVSRAFIRGSQQALERLETRDLKEHSWVAIFIDGIHFASRNVIVAVGLDTSGCKFVMGLKEGNTESAAICTDLLQDLIHRGLNTNTPFLFVVDGGKGLRRAISDVFGDNFPVQRCWIHKARNIEEYIPKHEYKEFRRRFKMLRSLERYSDAIQELNSLRHWLGRVNSTAAASLDEAGLELLTAIRIGSGPILRATIMTTNIIENIFSHVRYRTHRIKNWLDSPDKIIRWTAVCLLHAEKTTNRIHGYFECNEFKARLENLGLQQTLKVA
jgi:transposase-like protein